MCFILLWKVGQWQQVSISKCIYEVGKGDHLLPSGECGGHSPCGGGIGTLGKRVNVWQVCIETGRVGNCWHHRLSELERNTHLWPEGDRKLPCNSYLHWRCVYVFFLCTQHLSWITTQNIQLPNPQLRIIYRKVYAKSDLQASSVVIMQWPMHVMWQPWTQCILSHRCRGANDGLHLLLLLM